MPRLPQADGRLYAAQAPADEAPGLSEPDSSAGELDGTDDLGVVAAGVNCVRCTIRFDRSNPDTGDGYCLWCQEELRYRPGELARMRAEGQASPLPDDQDWKGAYRRKHPELSASALIGTGGA